ncbi:MAG: hypothetical protein B1H02_06555 [Candidatus Latescibacteria bacterium 4484_107]|nr:MAG: hypothetical protein B1H02_06555 [Candidatus Latescibacteria bacterium 4484_107]
MSFSTRLRRDFVTGLLVTAPAGLTIYIFWQLFLRIDGILDGFFGLWEPLRVHGRPFPGLGFVALIVVVVLTGMLARNYVGHGLLRAGDRLLSRIPLMNRIYLAIQQISQAVLSGKKVIFQRAVLIEYPRKNVYCIAFVTSEPRGEVQHQTAKDVVGVFVPTTPNPTSGFLLFVPKDEIVPLRMRVEEALKLVISGGAVSPAEASPIEIEIKQPAPIATEERRP